MGDFRVGKARRPLRRVRQRSAAPKKPVQLPWTQDIAGIFNTKANHTVQYSTHIRFCLLLFHVASNSSGYTVPTMRWLVNNELYRIWKKALQHLTGESEPPIMGGEEHTFMIAGLRVEI